MAPYRYTDITLQIVLRERNVLFNDSTHFIYGDMASDIWLRTILIVRKETRCHHIGYSYRLTARVLLYAPSHRQDNTYHGLCYTSRGALAGTRNSPMGGSESKQDLFTETQFSTNWFSLPIIKPDKNISKCMCACIFLCVNIY